MENIEPSAIDKATSHFRQRLNGELLSLDVPEWGEAGKPFKIYFKPLINFKAQEKIFKLVSDSKSSEALCMTLVIRALDKNGKNLFQEGHMATLMHEVDPDVVSGIVTKMGQESDDHETLKKT